MKTSICAALALLTFSSHAAENHLQAPDRVEWTGGALYGGVFDDGTRFQMELGYRFPPERGGAAGTKFHPAYWYPRFYQGTPIPLGGTEYDGKPLRLVRQAPAACNCQADDETFAVDLASDALTGAGRWSSASLRKQMGFTLRRAIVYNTVLVRRPWRDPASKREAPGRQFEYSAVYPLVGDAAADAWIREQAASCEYDQQCLNRIRVTWKSDSLMSLFASVWGYNDGAAHSNGHGRSRHYRVRDGRLTWIGFDAFVKPDPACRARISKAIVASLRKQKLSWAKEGALKAGREPDFTATPRGIAFHFDAYEVGSYAQGEPTAFVPLKANDACVRFLPAVDKR